MKRFVFKAFGAVHTSLYRASGGRIGGRMRGAPVLILTVTGRKSGKQRTTPLLYGREGSAYVLIASAGGQPKDPAWHLNLQGQDAELQVGREHVRVRARDAEGDERERLWAQMVALYPAYADYQQKTTRRIPVVVLEPVTA